MNARAAIIDQIKATCPSFALVAGISDFAVVTARQLPLTQLPAAYVFQVRHTGGRQQFASAFASQTLTLRYGVLLVTRHADDTAGALTSNANEALLEELEASLFGWLPSDDTGNRYAPLTILEGSIVNGPPEYHFWLEQYGTTREARRCPTNP